MADRITVEQRKKCMRSIKSCDTGIEKTLRLALWHKGYRYRKNYAKLPGKPDIVFTQYKIAVFCDSEFFHGKDWENSLFPQLKRGSNSDFWIQKISRNMERDKQVTAQLESAGWVVLRFWGKEIKKSLPSCIATIEDAIRDCPKAKNILPDNIDIIRLKE